jgi:hypothetical protein
MEPKKKRKESMKLLCVRVPEFVLDYFRTNYSDNYSAEIRDLLSEYVRAQLNGKHP